MSTRDAGAGGRLGHRAPATGSVATGNAVEDISPWKVYVAGFARLRASWDIPPKSGDLGCGYLVTSATGNGHPTLPRQILNALPRPVSGFEPRGVVFRSNWYSRADPAASNTRPDHVRNGPGPPFWPPGARQTLFPWGHFPHGPTCDGVTWFCVVPTRLADAARGGPDPT